MFTGDKGRGEKGSRAREHLGKVMTNLKCIKEVLSGEEAAEETPGRLVRASWADPGGRAFWAEALKLGTTYRFEG